MLSLLDLVLPNVWVLLLADLLVGVGVGFGVYRLFGRALASSPRRETLRGVGTIAVCVGALLLRDFYGPAFRLFFVSARDRPTRRFADRIQRSSEISRFREPSASPSSEWIRERGGTQVPQFSRYDVLWRGLKRLDDRELMLRNEILSRAMQGPAFCWNVSRSGELAVEGAIRSLPAKLQETWFDLMFRATLAEVRGSPPVRHADAESEQVFAALVEESKRLSSGASIIGGSLPAWGRPHCLEVQGLYATVVGSVPRRAGVERRLATEVPTPAGGGPPVGREKALE